MQLPRLALSAMMAVYSIVLIALELTRSQDHVRHYFSDIEGPVRLFAINTTLSVFLLWACALVFCVVLLMIHGVDRSDKERRFCLSQVAVFGYLGADDRFLLHERLSDVVPLHDTLILVTVGVFELAALALWGDLSRRSGRARLYLVLAAALFAIMAAIDAFLPSELTLRLSFEDLSKVWAGFFLFLFSWEILSQHVSALKEGSGVRIVLDSSRVLRWMAIIASCLVAAHVATRLLGDPADGDYLAGLGPFFDLDDEANLPTFYSTMSLLLAAAALAGLASCERDDRSRHPYWLGLAAIFLVLAADEATQLHELVGGLIETRITTSGFFYYSWIVPYAGLLLAVFLLTHRFLLSLPVKTRAMILIAGGVYATGVLGLEAMAARHDELHGQDNRTFTALATIEEMLEMGGIALFIYALLSYAEKEHGGLEVTVGRSRRDRSR